MRLVIETAGLACSVALFDDDHLVAATYEEVMRGHAERLLPMIADLPGGGRADEILVDCGPGSFTGVRVGLAAAQGLGIGWHVPVYGYSSLALLAACHFAQSDAATVTIAIPGGHGELFTQGFAREPFAETTPLRSQRPEVVTAPDLVTHGHALLDARRTSELTAAFRRLAALPIYGRGADAKPMATIP
jgi:tRNA threonylcarbamoyladenosine biosynthesis protein TsaB